MAVPTAASQPQAERVILSRIPFHQQSVAARLIADRHLAFLQWSGKHFRTAAVRDGGVHGINPRRAVEQRSGGRRQTQAVSRLHAQQRVQGP